MRWMRSLTNIRIGMAAVAAALVVALMISGCAFTTEGKVSRQLELGQKYLLEEDYEQAVIAFNKVIELDERRIDAYEGLVDVYTASGDYTAAIETWQQGAQYTDTLPADAQDLYQGYLVTLSEAIRDLSDDQEDVQQRIDWYHALLACDASLPAPYEGLLEIDLDQGDVDAAYEQYIAACKATGDTDIWETYRDRLEEALNARLEETDEEDDAERTRLLEMLATLCYDNLDYYKRYVATRDGDDEPEEAAVDLEEQRDEIIAVYEPVYVAYLQNTVLPMFENFKNVPYSYDYTAEDIHYELIFLDDDSIPELVFSAGSIHADGVSICTYTENGVEEITDNIISVSDEGGVGVGAIGSYGSIDYYEQSGLLIGGWDGGGQTTTVMYEVRDGNVEAIGSYEQHEMIRDGQYVIENGQVAYEGSGEIDGEAVTYEEAKAYLDSLTEGKERKTFAWESATALSLAGM